MQLSDLLNPDALAEQVAAGYIRAVTSPDGHYTLYNYTEQATFARHWTPETRACRGLVVDSETGAIVAAPFWKFANLNEPGFPDSSFEAVAARGTDYEVTAKLDGSMIAIWYDDYTARWRCTTRGSFTSTQAQAAQAWLNVSARWQDWPTPIDRAGARFTLLAEWCSPDNRVVLKYTEAELRLIGVRVIEPRPAFGGPCVHDLSHWAVTSWAEELGLPVVPLVAETVDALVAQQVTATGIEGWVLRWPGGFRVKVKTQEYLLLHKALSGFGPKQVYEAVLTDLQQAGTWERYLTGLPEEIRPDAERYYDTMMIAIEQRQQRLEGLYKALEPLLKAGRREFAIAVQREAPREDWSVLFALADAKPFGLMLWKQLDIRVLFGAEAEPAPVEEA